MVLVANYTFAIAGLDCVAGGKFMFVQKLEGQPIPPLGALNFKQGKIGVGENHGGRLLPGGGAGTYLFSGIYNITVYTAGHPTKGNTYEVAVAEAVPAAIVETPAFVYKALSDESSTLIGVSVTFTEEVTGAGVDMSKVSVINGVFSTPLAPASIVIRAGLRMHLFHGAIMPTDEGLVSISVGQGAATSLAKGRLTEPGSWVLALHQPHISRKSRHGARL